MRRPQGSAWGRAAVLISVRSLVHVAVLVYASDRTLMSTAARPHGLPWGKRQMASLDHAVWVHRPPRFDDWILYVSESPAAHAARGLVHGASVAQEGLIRSPRQGR